LCNKRRDVRKKIMRLKILYNKRRNQSKEDYDSMKKLTTREGIGPQRKKIMIVKKFTTREGRNQIWMVVKKLTGKEEQISDMAKPTNQVKNVTTTHPHTSPTGPAYIKLLPYKGTMPVNNVMVENAIAMHLKSVCTSIPQQLLIIIIIIIINNNNKTPTPNLSATKQFATTSSGTLRP
jgi:hypothetical protein